MRVLVNACSTVMGGAIQVATEFVRRMWDDSRCEEWSVAASKEVAAELERFGILPGERLRVISPAPSHSRQSRKQLARLAAEVDPDVIYTVFGPAFVRFRKPHVCGVADPWVTHATALAFKVLGLSPDGIKMPARLIYKGFWFRAADRWIVEAPVAKEGLIYRWRLEPDKIHVVANNSGSHYVQEPSDSKLYRPGETLRLLTFSTYYKHKNLELLPEIASALRNRRPELAFEMITTLPSPYGGRLIAQAEELGVGKHIKNIGPVPVIDGPKLYRDCHMILLPTVLETFSANYPEAMLMQRPIVTSDLQFARDICRDAAVYFDPTSGDDAARKILELVDDTARWERLAARGAELQQMLPSPSQKFEMVFSILSEAAGSLALQETSINQ